ncbi:hypothetical protein HXX76_007055 [Chlamydomonas incerta]|uniref:Uncharacterized protein n=1 Tax=Chlamydomonas incerta TaxID=51695 RepID=A0A835TDC9_CHLIN|nr:hypothetical protein HXX76_007055 [Chlamydomonas incerta]|eukprot:KAG2435860.1 hypothetical protein HXX76_007055 [Chlamydomonas incerta]
MADSKQHSTPVADDWNWTARIRNELGANKAWERNWGFLAEQSASPDSLAAFMTKSKAAGGDKGLEGMSYIAARQRDSAREATRRAREATQQRKQQPHQTQQAKEQQPEQEQQERGGAAGALRHQDSLDGFVADYLPRDPKTRKLPAQEFRKPLTTSHDYGWGRNLEVFGQMALVLK